MSAFAGRVEDELGPVEVVVTAAAREAGRYGVHVNAIAPGFLATGMTDPVPASARERALLKIPLGRFGTAEEVAGLTEFLASDRASRITGQVFGIDGGLVL